MAKGFEEKGEIQSYEADLDDGEVKVSKGNRRMRREQHVPDNGSGAVNHAPVLAALSDRTAHPGTPVSFPVSATDIDGDMLTFTLVNSPGMIAAAGNMGTYSWTPGWADLGARTITVRVSDPGGLSDTRSCTVSVVNTAPHLNDMIDRSAHPGIPVTFTVSANDIDGDALTFVLVGCPGTLTAAGNFATFSWTPTWADLGAKVITVKVTDPGGLSDTKSCLITVGNQAPTLSALTDRTAHPGVPVMFTAFANDPEGDALTFQLISSPGTITATGNLVTFNWTPAWADLGAHTITLRVSDPGNLADTQACIVNVTNQAPVMNALADVPMAKVGMLTTFQATANDPEGDMLTYSLISPPGTATITPTGTFQWTPVAGDIGAHTVTIRATDPGGLSDTRSCTVTVVA